MGIADFFLRLTFLVAAIFFFCLNSIEGQKDIFVIHEIGTKQKLTDSRYNYYIHQDNAGLVWISSIAGLNRFDGQHIKTYLSNRTDTTSIRSVYVSTSEFHDSSDGNIWFTEDEAVIKYHREQDNFKRFYAKNSEGNTAEVGYSWSQLDTVSGLLWFHIEEDELGYLYTCDTRQEGHPIEFITQLNVGIKDKMIRMPNGKSRLFSAGSKELNSYTIDTTGNLICSPTPAPAGLKLYSVLPINHYLCWVATSKGLYSFDLTTRDWKPFAGKYKNQVINDTRELAFWRPDALLVATSNDGIYFYNPLTQTYTGKIRRFINDTIESFEPKLDRIYVDEDSNLWISTKDKGIYYTSLTKPKFNLQLIGEAAISMTGTEANKPVILGLEKVYYFNNKEVNAIPIPVVNDAYVKPKCIFQDKKQRLWLGTESALYYKEVNQSSFKIFENFPDSLHPGNFTSITALPNGNLLFGNIKASPVQININTLKGSDFGLISKVETNFVQYLDGYLFAYNDDNYLQLFHYQDNNFTLDTVLHPLAIINQMAADPNRSCFWLATDNGLHKLSQNQAKVWQLEPQFKLREHVISSLLLDDNGQIWMGTPRGLLIYNPSTTYQHYYSDSDLIQDHYFTRTSAWKAENGTLFFGGMNGINYFQPSCIESKIDKAQPIIVELLINHEEGVAQEFSRPKNRNPHLIESIKLPYNKNNLTLHLSAGEYSDPENCYFLYHLEGSYDNKINIHKERILPFNNLSSGKYTLKIWAVNADGQRSSVAKSLAITINPHPGLSTLAIITYFVIAILGVYFYFTTRLQRLTRERHLEQAVAEAQLQAEETKTAVLRLQMNPHFIFNSLVAIKSLVSKNDQPGALAFLSLFSKLMRKILDESEKQINSLEEEIELLDNYLALEKLRFKDKMTYSFYVDPNLDAYETVLPTMILQPFVENAIIHGIRNKSTSGHIQINFIAAGENLCCEVRDNGIGRGGQNNKSSHQSKATDITKKRLKSLAASMNLASIPQFEIIDEFEENGTPAGTTVKFSFPPFY